MAIVFSHCERVSELIWGEKKMENFHHNETTVRRAKRNAITSERTTGYVEIYSLPLAIPPLTIVESSRKQQTSRSGNIYSEKYAIAVSVKTRFQLTLRFSLFPLFLFIRTSDVLLLSSSAPLNIATIATLLQITISCFLVFICRRQVCTQT